MNHSPKSGPALRRNGNPRVVKAVTLVIPVILLVIVLSPLAFTASDGDDYYSYTISTTGTISGYTAIGSSSSGSYTSADGSNVGSWGFDENGYGPFNSFYAAFDPQFDNIMVGHVNPNNLNQLMDGTDITGYGYNIMWILPTVYWYTDSDGNLILTNDPDAGGTAYAHTIEGKTYKYLALGVYEASTVTLEEDGTTVLSSTSGSMPFTKQTKDGFRTYANSQKVITDGENEDGLAMLWNFYQWELYKYCVYAVCGSLNTQSVAGNGYIYSTSNAYATTTGALDTAGPYAGTRGTAGTTYIKNPVKVFLENTWGGVRELVDGVIVKSKVLYIDTSAVPTDETSGEWVHSAITLTGTSGWQYKFSKDDEVWGICTSITSSTSYASKSGYLSDYIYGSTGSNTYEWLVGGNTKTNYSNSTYYYEGVSYVNYSLLITNTSSATGTRLAFVFDNDECGYKLIVSYNTDGGMGEFPQYTEVFRDSMPTYTSTTEQPTLEYHTFKGWSTNQSDSEQEYDPGGTEYTFTRSTRLKLTAVWEENPKYTETLTYDANGGDADSAPETDTYTGYDEGYSFTISSTVPTYDHHTFLGWSTDSNATTAAYEPTGSFFVAANSTGTLYAVWVEDPKYTQTLLYDLNGYAGTAPATVSNVGYDYEGTFTITSYTGTREHYTFLGWSTSNRATEAEYTERLELTIQGNNTVILYAVWLEDTIYTETLTFDANGGDGAPFAQTYTGYDVGYSFTISSTEPTRDLYSFKGWSTEQNATSATYAAGNTITVSAKGSVTLYAVWEAYPTITGTLVFDADGGSGAPESETRNIQTLDTEVVFTFTIPDTVPTRTNYTFKGWSTSSNSTVVEYQPGNPVTVTVSASDTDMSNSVTLYAVWEEYPTYKGTVVYDANGGDGAPSAQTDEVQSNAESGTITHTFSISSTVPTREHFTFLGWSTDSSAESAEYTACMCGDSCTCEDGSCGCCITIPAGSTVILYAVWKEDPKYTETLTYDANGGTGAPSTQTYTGYDVGYSFTVSDTVPTRDNCTFLGWSTENSATTATYSSGQTITVKADSSVTLYAVWEAYPTYTGAVAYDANGGNENSVPNTQTYTVQTLDAENSVVFVATVSDTVPTREHYTFLGWSIDQGGTIVYSAGSTITIGTAGATLYAVWQENPKYTETLIYDPNGGTEGPASEIIYDYDVGYSFTISGTEPVRDNFTFLGWSTDSNATTATYKTGDSITVQTSETVILYAVWEEHPKYTETLTYDANGGDTDSAPDTNTYTWYDVGYSFTVSDTVPTREHHTFLGWSTDSSATSATYATGDTVFAPADSTVTLYAVWKEDPIYAEYLAYNANGGSGAPSYQTYTGYEDEYTFTVSDTVPTRANHTFLGWSDELDGAAEYQPGDSVDVPAGGEVTLYAVWEEDPIYTETLTYDANGGTGAPSTQTYTGYDVGYSFTVSDTVPTREHHTFLGWSTDSSATRAGYTAGDVITVESDGSVTLYAVWKEDPKYTETLTYDANGGDADSAPETDTYTWYDEGHTFTVSDTVPTREHFTFLGWSAESDATTATFHDGNSITVEADSSVTLYAVWKEDPKYTETLVYHRNGGNSAPDANVYTGYEKEHDFTISSTEPTREHFTFLGWSTDSDATTATYKTGDSITVQTSKTVILYAVWKEDPKYTETLTYDANGGDGAPSAQTYTWYDVGYSFTISSTEPTREHFTLLGWSKKADATSASYKAGSTITVSAGETVTLYAVWKEDPKYTETLTYDANGGDGAPSALTYTGYDKGYVFTVSTTIPTLTNYTFKGWSTSSSADTVEYQPGNSILISANSGTTLYAVWMENPKYKQTLTFYANGGSGGPSTLSYTGYEEGSSFTIPSTTPKLANHTFKGWGPDENTVSYFAGDTVFIAAGNTLVLYAVWVENPKYSQVIHYSTEGSTDTPSSESYYGYSENNTFTVSPIKPTREHHTFLGWSTVSGGSTEYSDGDSITVSGNSTVTLYAVWLEDPKYIMTLTYDNNYSTLTLAGVYDVHTYEDYEMWYVFTISDTVPTREHYTFLGWSTSPTDGSPAYYAGETIYVHTDEPVTLYAVWEEDPQYTETLTYDANGGTGAPSTQTYTGYDVGYSFTISSTIPTRDGYAFLGWSTSSTAKTATYVAGGTASVSFGSTLTLYAVWAPYHTVSFDSTGGSPVEEQRIVDGDTATEPPKPTLDSFVFSGWYTDAELTTAYDWSSPVVSDLVLYAAWEEAPDYTVLIIVLCLLILLILIIVIAYRRRKEKSSV